MFGSPGAHDLAPQVLQVRKDLFQHFRTMHGKRIKRDRDGTPSAVLSVEMRLGWAAGDWMWMDNHVFSFFSASKNTYEKWGLLQVPGGLGGQLGRASGGRVGRAGADAHSSGHQQKHKPSSAIDSQRKRQAKPSRFNFQVLYNFEYCEIVYRIREDT